MRGGDGWTGDQADRALAEVDALVQLLRELHGLARAEPEPVGGGGGEEGGGGGDEEKKQQMANERACCSCKKLKTKKKGKNRTRVRKLPGAKYQALNAAHKELIRAEFKLDTVFVNANAVIAANNAADAEDIKLRLCYDCFKKILGRLQELAAVDGVPSTDSQNVARNEKSPEKEKPSTPENGDSVVAMEESAEEKKEKSPDTLVVPAASAAEDASRLR